MTDYVGLRFVAPSRTKRGVIIVGGGHNGLVSAAYLAEKGLDVLVLERRHVVGEWLVELEFLCCSSWSSYAVPSFTVNWSLRCTRGGEFGGHTDISSYRHVYDLTPIPCRLRLATSTKRGRTAFLRIGTDESAADA